MATLGAKVAMSKPCVVSRLGRFSLTAHGNSVQDTFACILQKLATVGRIPSRATRNRYPGLAPFLMSEPIGMETLDPKNDAVFNLLFVRAWLCCIAPVTHYL
jgi:hypothetical protein